MKTQNIILMLVAVTLLFPGTLLGDTITFTLTNPVQTGAPGATLVFTGTLTNPNAVEEFLNGDSVTNNNLAALVVDDSPFLNAPLSLAAAGSAGDSSGPIELFDVMIAANAAPGTYAMNFFNITGGPLSTSGDLLASQEFTVDVASPVPEPGSMALLASGIGMAFLLRRRTL